MLRYALVALIALASAFAQDTPTREKALQQRLVAACCWSESVAVHRSPVSLEMRTELRHLIDQGKSDEEILAWFKTKYGARVLIEPEGAQGALAYATVAVAAILGLVAVIVLIRRWTRAVAPEAATHG